MTSLYIENYEIEDKFSGLEVLLSTHSLFYCGKHVKLRRGACCSCLGVLVGRRRSSSGCSPYRHRGLLSQFVHENSLKIWCWNSTYVVFYEALQASVSRKTEMSY